MDFLDKNCQAFLALLRAGLWEKEVYLSNYGKIDYDKILLLAQEQAVVGLVAAGIEYIKDVIIPQEFALQFVGLTLKVEQRNIAMNAFIANMVKRMRESDIYTLLVKGQGIAQCYERPLWRVSGDIDFFLSDSNYEKAKMFLLSLSSDNKLERQFSKELGMNIVPWYVEIHGSLRTGLSSRLDKMIDTVQEEIFYGGNVRSWENGDTPIFMPAVNEDIFFVFTHFIKHFYKEGGVTIRQMCDWCRLLWCYRSEIDLQLLEKRIRKAGLIAEWRAFAALAVDYLRIPVESMPLYRTEKKWSKKAEKIMTFILNGGEWRRFKDTLSVGRIFPISTLEFLPGILFSVTCLKIKERICRVITNYTNVIYELIDII